MKALISPNEVFTYFWVTSWRQVNDIWLPESSDSIEGCVRIAEVEEIEFEVATPLFWVDCPEDCNANNWYYKDGQVYQKPQNAPIPEES